MSAEIEIKSPANKVFLSIDLSNERGNLELIQNLNLAKVLGGVKIGQLLHIHGEWTKMVRMARDHQVGEVFIDADYTYRDPILLEKAIKTTGVSSVAGTWIGVHRAVGRKNLHTANRVKGQSKLVVASISQHETEEDCLENWKLSRSDMVKESAEWALESKSDAIMAPADCIQVVDEVDPKRYLTRIALGISLNETPGYSHPKQALENGADILAIGRAITAAEDPEKQIQLILNTLH